MSIQLQIEEKPGYIKARFIDAGAPEEVERQFKSLAEKCKSSKKNKLALRQNSVRPVFSITSSSCSSLVAVM
jgi:hypothetical protein